MREAVMRISRRDVLASLVMLAVVVPFAGYLVRGSMPFVEDSRGMAGVVLAGTLVLLALQWRDALAHGNAGQAVPLVLALTVGATLLTLAVGTSSALLVPAVAGVVALWALGVAHDHHLTGGSPW
jgi:hypothetical protein